MVEKKNGTHGNPLQQYAGESDAKVVACIVSRCQRTPTVPVLDAGPSKRTVGLCAEHLALWAGSGEAAVRRPTSFMDWLNRIEKEDRR